ncbi:MAG: hypothetical protein KBG20_18245 [Caldilineaceae bacterium]|nr:hypothetical protein [Caldilineaceae bacterium]MBP8109402.1 hypothetical protein [Caldilineaceae bacterium]MBP8124277.1 hypothetical protein [Caldilineaceae bacterium]MBP9074253.1 hypothetical protein [Caldilineaceae bacterium]
MPVQVIDLSGTPYQMGVAHGRLLRDEIHAFYRTRLGYSINEAAEVGVIHTEASILATARQHLVHFERDLPQVWAEFVGIAEGAGMDPARLYVTNGQTDLVDHLRIPSTATAVDRGCTAILVGGGRSSTGHALLAQTWDMHPDAEQFVRVFRRRPLAEDGTRPLPASLVLSTAGCLSLTGISASGVGMGTNDLKPDDARDGLMYLALIHNALAQADLGSAVAAIRDARRASGHNYLFAGDRSIVNLEATAAEYELFQSENEIYAHGNHYLTPRFAVRDQMDMSQSTSPTRCARVDALLAEKGDAPLGPADLWAYLANREDGENSICRINHPDVTTCAAVVLSPATGEMWATAGDALQNEAIVLRLRD